MNRSLLLFASFLLGISLVGCGGGDAPTDGGAPMTDSGTRDSGPPRDGGGMTDAGTVTGPIDITDRDFSNPNTDCAAYVGEYQSMVVDVGRGVPLTGMVAISANATHCMVMSNGIPNRDFNATGSFAFPIAEITASYTFTQSPAFAASATPLTLLYDNAILLNGVKVDRLAAACYGVGPDPLGRERIGCMTDGTPWRYDPMFPGAGFGADEWNAHTQGDGAYHYHGDPGLYDDSGGVVSGVVGFAADGFPIFGPWFDDGGTIRRARSGYTLRSGARVSQPGEGAFPGGTYDGTFVDDWEFTGAGDLDECNGMMRDGVYGYTLTDTFPWVLNCYRGTPDASFRKAPPMMMP